MLELKKRIHLLGNLRFFQLRFVSLFLWFRLKGQLTTVLCTFLYTRVKCKVETQVCVRFGLHKIINKDIVFDEAIMLKKKVKQHTSAKDVVKLMNQVIFEEKHPPTRTQTQGEE